MELICRSLVFFGFLSSLFLSGSTQTLNVAPAMAPTAGDLLSGVQKMNSTLKSICVSTKYPDLCASTIAPIIADGSTDPVKVLEIAITACLNQTKKIHQAIIDSSEEWQKRLFTPANKIAECKGYYESSLEYLEKALDALEIKDVGTTRTMLSDAMSKDYACIDAFQIPAFPCPFIDDSDEFTHLAENSLDILATIR